MKLRLLFVCVGMNAGDLGLGVNAGLVLVCIGVNMGELGLGVNAVLCPSMGTGDHCIGVVGVVGVVVVGVSLFSDEVGGVDWVVVVSGVVAGGLGVGVVVGLLAYDSSGSGSLVNVAASP